MFKNKKYYALVLVCVAIFSLFLGGLLFRQFFGVPFHYMHTFSIVVFKGEYAYAQYREGDYETGKEALLNYLALLNELKKLGWNRDKYMGLHEYYQETGCAYGRLALLEERAGNIADKVKYFTESRNNFKLAGWKDYSEENIRFFLLKRDAYETSNNMLTRNDTTYLILVVKK